MKNSHNYLSVHLLRVESHLNHILPLQILQSIHKDTRTHIQNVRIRHLDNLRILPKLAQYFFGVKENQHDRDEDQAYYDSASL